MKHVNTNEHDGIMLWYKAILYSQVMMKMFDAWWQTLRSMITLFWGIRGIHSEAMRKFFEHDLIHLRNSYFDLRMMEFIMEHDGNTCMHSGTAWSYFEARWHSQRFMMEMWRGIYWEAWFHSLRIMMEILWHTVPHTHKSEIFGAFTLVEF